MDKPMAQWPKYQISPCAGTPCILHIQKLLCARLAHERNQILVLFAQRGLDS